MKMNELYIIAVKPSMTKLATFNNLRQAQIALDVLI